MLADCSHASLKLAVCGPDVRTNRIVHDEIIAALALPVVLKITDKWPNDEAVQAHACALACELSHFHDMVMLVNGLQSKLTRVGSSDA